MTTPPGGSYRTLLAPSPAALPVGFRSSATRGTAAMVLVGIAVAAYCAQIVAQASQLAMLDAAEAGTLTQAAAEANDSRVLALASLGTLTYIVSAIGVLAWLWRAVGNATTLTSHWLRWSRNEAVGWWFVPLANYVMPYRIVRDAFHALGDGASATIVTAWWVCFVGSNILGIALTTENRMALDTLEGLRRIVTTTVVMLAVQVAAGLLLVLVIRRMEGMARARERARIPETAQVPDWSRPTHWQEEGGRAVDVQPGGDGRRIETVVTSSDGPLAPPPPPASAA